MKKLIQNSNHIINIDFSRTNKISSRITDVDVIIDLMIHDIDLALNINGEVEKIKSYGYIENNMIEYARAILTHKNSSFSNIVASRITEKKIRYIAVTCNNMYIDCNLLSKKLSVNKQSTEQYFNNVSISSKQETIFVKEKDALLLELIDFISICQGKNINIPNQNDGFSTMKVANQIKKQIIENVK